MPQEKTYQLIEKLNSTIPVLILVKLSSVSYNSVIAAFRDSGLTTAL